MTTKMKDLLIRFIKQFWHRATLKQQRVLETNTMPQEEKTKNKKNKKTKKNAKQDGSKIIIKAMSLTTVNTLNGSD